MIVRPGSFYPPPKVMSMVLQLSPRKQSERAQCNPRQLAHVVKQAFSARRKKLLNALAPLFSSETLHTLGIADRRAQTLSLTEYIHLANLLSHKTNAPLSNKSEAI